VGLTTEVAFLPYELLLRRRMRRAGRYLHPRTLASLGGTILSDSPSFSWAIGRLWWTPDDVLALAPTPPETREERSRALRAGHYVWHPFDRWVWERYLSPETGTAFLFGIWHPGRLLKKVRRRYPQIAIVQSWSGGRDLEEHMKRSNEVRDAVVLAPLLRRNGED
jgi:hypothetical protein